MHGRLRATRTPILLAAGVLAAIAAGWWVAASAADPLGQITESPPGGLNPGSSPGGIVSGPDGNLWFTDDGSTPAIGRITLSGQITEYSAGLNPGSSPGGLSSTSIAAGPDGNLWFTDESMAIGRITTSGQITEYTPGLNPGSIPEGIAAGPDGNLWFADAGCEHGGTCAIGRITPSGQINEYTSPVLNATSFPQEIARGPDGNLWFTDLGCERGGTCAIGRVTTSGQITEYSAGLNGGLPEGIAAGPDGNVWFTDSKTPAIWRITPAGKITEYTPGLNPGSAPVGIAQGRDRNLWFTDEGNTTAIGRIGAGVSAATTVGPPPGGSLYQGNGTLTGGFSGHGAKVSINNKSRFQFCLRVARGGQVTAPSPWAIGLTHVTVKVPDGNGNSVFDASGLISGAYKPKSRFIFLTGTVLGVVTVEIKGLGPVTDPIKLPVSGRLQISHPTLNRFVGDAALGPRNAQTKSGFKSTEQGGFTARRVERCTVTTPPSLG